MKAVILAGGLGTRLRAVVGDRPKAMANVHGKPFLAYQIANLRAQGFDELVLCLGYRSAQIQDYFGDGRRHRVSIAYSVEPEPLGTAGALRHAAALLDDAFLLVNGDSFLDADFQDFVASHRRRRSENPETIGSVAAIATADKGTFATLVLDARGLVQRFGVSTGPGRRWVNAGLYVVEPGLLDLIPTGRAVSLERETTPAALAAGARLWAYPVQGLFVDIGTPAGYRRFGEAVAQGLPSRPWAAPAGARPTPAGGDGRCE